MGMLSAKPITSNNISNITVSAAKASDTKVESIKIATSNLFLNSSNIPSYKSIEDLVLETLNSAEILDYGNTQAATISNTGTGVNGFQDDNSDLINNILYPNIDYENEVPSGGTVDGGTGGGVLPILRSIEYYYPRVGNGTNGEFVYLNSNNNLVIELVNIEGGQYVEVEFWKYETELNDTIYS
jgi:cellulose synthase/poly-beta-1,6-N-acetylglucosamine synthase-like glycosyltransferase